MSTPDETSRDDESEAQLMAGVAAGDAAAFERLLARHLGAVHHYLQRLSGSSSDADDLAQETFLRALTKAGEYRAKRGRLSTWLHRVAHNLWIDETRKRRPAPAGAGHREAAAPPDATLVASDRARAVNEALAGLPENQRCAIVLCQQQGLSNREAAEVLGVSIRALESLLARARRQLKTDLAHLIDR